MIFDYPHRLVRVRGKSVLEIVRLIQIASDQPILFEFARLGMHVVRQEKSSESFRSKNYVEMVFGPNYSDTQISGGRSAGLR